MADALPGARVLDLFAGTGAMGLEALSRGARRLDLVERNPSALHALKANVATLKVRNQTRIFKKDAFTFLRGVEGVAYELAIADPPYGAGLAARIVEIWQTRPFAGLLLVETAGDAEMPGGGQTRTSGTTALHLYGRV